MPASTVQPSTKGALPPPMVTIVSLAIVAAYATALASATVSGGFLYDDAAGATAMSCGAGTAPVSQLRHRFWTASRKPC